MCIRDSRNRYAAIQSKVESQQSKIDVLQKELSLLRAENEELRHILPAPESPKYAPAKVEPEINYADMLAAIFTNKKIVFIGGHQNIMNKFSQKYPDAVVIPHDKAVLANQPLEAADAVLFKTDSMGHKAVSYTHLDVYKRQAYCKPVFPFWVCASM